MRDGTDEANPQFNEAGCHWTQIRLPNSLSGSDVSVQVECGPKTMDTFLGVSQKQVLNMSTFCCR